MDDDRVRVLTRPNRPWLAATALVAVVGSACVASGPAPSPLAASTVEPSPSSHPLASGRADPSRPTAPASGESSFEPPPAPGATIVCESWGAEPPPDEIRCKDAVGPALDAIVGLGAGPPHDLEIRYGRLCDGNGACDRRADVRTVVARFPSFETRILRIDHDPTGEIRVGPAIAGDPAPPDPFAAPAISAPSVGADAPIQLLDRTPLPFCGREEPRAVDDYDTAARRCFLAGIAAWTPVEVQTVQVTDDGVRILTVLRYRGGGPIESYIRTAGGWSASACAISPIATIAVFLITSPCERIELGP